MYKSVIIMYNLALIHLLGPLIVDPIWGSNSMRVILPSRSESILREASPASQGLRKD